MTQCDSLFLSPDGSLALDGRTISEEELAREVSQGRKLRLIGHDKVRYSEAMRILGLLDPDHPTAVVGGGDPR